MVCRHESFHSYVNMRDYVRMAKPLTGLSTRPPHRQFCMRYQTVQLVGQRHLFYQVFPVEKSGRLLQTTSKRQTSVLLESAPPGIKENIHPVFGCGHQLGYLILVRDGNVDRQGGHNLRHDRLDGCVPRSKRARPRGGPSTQSFYPWKGGVG